MLYIGTFLNFYRTYVKHVHNRLTVCLTLDKLDVASVKPL